MVEVNMASIRLVFELAWQQFAEQYRAADNRLLRWVQGCLLFLLILLSMTSFNIQQYLDNNMEQLLGADVVVTTFSPIRSDKLEYLEEISDKISLNKLIEVTLAANGQYHQAQLKVVDNHYPVQGQLQVSRELGGAVSAMERGPMPGEIWVDARLLVALQLKVGDALNVADKSLVLSHIIEHEPDRLMEGHSVAMRAMVHQDSLDSHAFASSHKDYRYLMESKAPKALVDWTAENIPGAKVLHRSGGHPLALFWLRVENFIGLSSVLLFLMAAIAIDLISRRHLVKQKRFVAVIMSMGTSRSMAITIGFVQWVIAFLALLPIILLLVYGALYFVIDHLQTQFVGLEMLWSWREVLESATILLLLLLSFQVPGAIELNKVTVADLIRATPNVSSVTSRFIWSLISIGMLTAIYADNWLLTAMTLGVMLTTIVLLMSLTWILLTIFEKLTQGRVGMLPFALFMMKQRLLSKSTQILGVGLCALLLLSTLGLMRDLGGTIEKYRRTHDGNLIISRADDEQVAAIEQWAQDTKSTVKYLKPFASAQLMTINDTNLADFTDRPSDSMTRLERPVRLHYTDKLPQNNAISGGTWWQAGTDNYRQVSVEEEILTDLGLEYGDKLTFQVDGNLHSFEIVSGHVYNSGNGSITFWFQVPLSFQSTYQPKTLYMGSLELPDEAWGSLWQLWQRFATLKMISIAQLTEKFDEIVDMVTSVVGAGASMISLLAILVIIASVKGYEVEERRKNGLMLSFGQSKVACIRLALYEWLITGFIAAMGAIVGTVMMGNVVFESQFRQPYYPDWMWMLTNMAVVILFIVFVGLLGSRSSLQSSPKDLLQS